MKREKKENEEKGSFSNVAYMMKMLWKSSKSLVVYTIYKNITENVFYVFFFVYMTQYIYTCIEQQTPFNNLFWFILILCICHIVVHLTSAGHMYWEKTRLPDVNRSIFLKVIEKSTKMEYKRFEQPDFYDKFTRALDETVSRGYNMLLEMSFF